MYTLYGGGYTRAHMTEMVFAEVQVPFELKLVDTLKGENRTPKFLEINPTGFVPALRTPDGKVLFETAAINLYLAELHGAALLAPSIDEPDRGLFLSSLFYITDELEPTLKRYFYPNRYGVRESDELKIREKSLQYIYSTTPLAQNAFLRFTAKLCGLLRFTLFRDKFRKSTQNVDKRRFSSFVEINEF